MSEKKSTEKNVKKRNWTFIVYPESAPSDWKNTLQGTGLEIAISPLHDKDVNPTGEAKKPHYHVIGCWPGPTTYATVKALCDSLNAPIPKPLESVKGMYRYLTHMDNPEKFQYNEVDIETLNGFNIMNYMTLSSFEVSKYKRELQSLIRDKDFSEYCDLLDYLMDAEEYEMLDVAQSHTVFINAYLKSRKYKALEAMKGIRVDPSTGAIIE